MFYYRNRKVESGNRYLTSLWNPRWLFPVSGMGWKLGERAGTAYNMTISAMGSMIDTGNPCLTPLWNPSDDFNFSEFVKYFRRCCEAIISGTKFTERAGTPTILVFPEWYRWVVTGSWCLAKMIQDSDFRFTDTNEIFCNMGVFGRESISRGRKSMPGGILKSKKAALGFRKWLKTPKIMGTSKVDANFKSKMATYTVHRKIRLVVIWVDC